VIRFYCNLSFQAQENYAKEREENTNDCEKIVSWYMTAISFSMVYFADKRWAKSNTVEMWPKMFAVYRKFYYLSQRNDSLAK